MATSHGPRTGSTAPCSEHVGLSKTTQKQQHTLTIGEVEAVGRLGRPEPQSVDCGVHVARNGIVVSHGHHYLSVLPAIDLRRPKEADWNGVLGTRQLPAVPKLEPVIRNLHLGNI